MCDFIQILFTTIFSHKEQNVFLSQTQWNTEITRSVAILYEVL